VHRRFVDRLISLAWPQRRYRCLSLGCEWQGNLSAKGADAGVPPAAGLCATAQTTRGSAASLLRQG